MGRGQHGARAARAAHSLSCRAPLTCSADAQATEQFVYELDDLVSAGELYAYKNTYDKYELFVVHDIYTKHIAQTIDEHYAAMELINVRKSHDLVQVRRAAPRPARARPERDLRPARARAQVWGRPDRNYSFVQSAGVLVQGATLRDAHDAIVARIGHPQPKPYEEDMLAFSAQARQAYDLKKAQVAHLALKDQYVQCRDTLRALRAAAGLPWEARVDVRQGQ